MSCSPFDLRDYFLKELTDPQQRQMEAHVKTCQPCREEVERLRLTEAALFELRDEEIPQRIAFVSDKIFEPSAWRRWAASFWTSGARLGFASAAMLSAAILFSAFTRPAPALDPVNVATNTAAVSTISAEDIDHRIQAAVTRAVAESEARQTQKTEQLVSDIKKRESEAVRQYQALVNDTELNLHKTSNERLQSTFAKYDAGDQQ